MEAWVWIILIFVLLGGGAWFRDQFENWVENRREIKRHKLGITPPKPPPAPICGCEHNFSFHDPRTGKCHATVRQTVKWERDFELDNEDDMVPVAWEIVPCPCCRYVGPEPLTTLYSPELTDVAVEEQTQRGEPGAEGERLK